MKFHDDGSLPPQTHHVWVFGSNLAGIHGGGAARVASDLYNRPYGVAYASGIYESFNLQESYAIPTKDRRIATLPLPTIQNFVNIFIDYVEQNPQKEFFITRIGCVLAGYGDEDIAPMFKALADKPNVSFAKQWKPFLEEETL